MKRISLVTMKTAWLADIPLRVGRRYKLMYGSVECTGEALKIKAVHSSVDGVSSASSSLCKDELALVDWRVDQGVVPDILGEYWVMLDGEKVGHLTVEYELRRSTNIVWQETDVDRNARAHLKKQTPLTLWFTGLSGSGKSTLANEVEKFLLGSGYHTMLLDGDNIRHGLNKNLGFTETDRIENIRRVSEVAKLLNDAGVIVLAAFISPYTVDRQRVKEIVGEAYREVFVSTPLIECEKRDVKGLYAQARSGLIPNFTGVTAPYEMPDNADLSIDTSKISIVDAANKIINRFFTTNKR